MSHSLIKFPTKEDIISAIFQGINEAKNNYTFWTSDELYLSYAPAKFLSIHVSQEIAKLKHAPEIFIDASIADILRCSLPKRDQFRVFMKQRDLSQGVISLTLDERFEHKSDNDSISRVVISLKNGVRNAHDEYKKEIETLCKMLHRDTKDGSTLDYGVFAFYLDISNSARKKAKKRIKEIVLTFDEIVKQYPNLQSNFQGGDINTIENIGEWCVGCYVIEPTLS